MGIVVAGSTGLVGSALVRAFEKAGKTVIGINRQVVDLQDRNATIDFFREIKPNFVIDAAAKVGGIGASNSNPVEFLVQNVQIQNNLMEAAHLTQVKKFVFLGSGCAYPRDGAQPLKEEYFMTGPLEKSNSAFAVAKIAGIELINSYKKEYGYDWFSLMPTNIYGPADNFDLETSHLIPALIRRFLEASELGLPSVTLWGTGSPLRDFLHADDLASAIMVSLDEAWDFELLNIGSGTEIKVLDIARVVAEAVGFHGEVFWDSSRPNGTPRKILDSSRINALGWSPQISLEDGIRNTIDWYREHRSLDARTT